MQVFLKRDYLKMHIFFSKTTNDVGVLKQRQRLFYWRLNDPFCSERGSDAAATAASKIVNAFEWPGQPPKISPFPWGSAPSDLHPI